MHTDSSSNKNTMLFILVGGAALGALTMALTSPKSGQEVRNTLRSAARRLSGKAEGPDELDTGTIEALFI